MPEIVTQPPSSAAVSENRSQREVDLNGDLDNDIEGSDSHIHGMNEEDAAKDWEHELDETVQCPPAKIKDWWVLQMQIKKDLQRKSKILTLSAIIQLIILSNFAMLRLKGASQIGASEEIAPQWHEGEGKYFAWHYQNFEQQLSIVVDTRMQGHF